MNEILIGVFALFVAVLFATIPGLKQWFNNLGSSNPDPEYAKSVKRLFMATLLFVFTLAVFGINCAGWMDGIIPELVITCDKSGAQTLIVAYLMGIGVNQGTYWLLPSRFKKK